MGRTNPMQFEIESLRADLRAEIGRLRAEIERLRADPDPGQRIWDDLYYLRSILRMLRDVRTARWHIEPSLKGEVLADNIDWLDCYIDRCAKSVQNGENVEKANEIKQG